MYNKILFVINRMYNFYLKCIIFIRSIKNERQHSFFLIQCILNSLLHRVEVRGFFSVVTKDLFNLHDDLHCEDIGTNLHKQFEEFQHIGFIFSTTLGSPCAEWFNRNGFSFSDSVMAVDN